jgi:hypothetical protein
VTTINIKRNSSNIIFALAIERIAVN